MSSTPSGRGSAGCCSLRFGLIDGHQRTLEEVGKRIGVTRERIRQIEFRALRKLAPSEPLHVVGNWRRGLD